MTCEQCGGKVYSGRCIICGYNREEANKKFELEREKEDRKRSLRLIIFTIFQVAYGLLSIVITIMDARELRLLGICWGISFALIRITLALCIFFYQKWAFYVLIVPFFIDAVIKFMIAPTYFSSFLIDLFFSLGIYFWIVNRDWHKFK